MSDKSENEKDMLAIISSLQSAYITQGIEGDIFNSALADLVSYTRSKFGFICDRRKKKRSRGPFFLLAVAGNTGHALQRFFEKEIEAGSGNTFLHLLIEETIRGDHPHLVKQWQEPEVIRLGPDNDLALRCWLGIPLRNRNNIVGMIGLVNRPGGYDTNLINRLAPFFYASSTIISALQKEHSQDLYEEALKENLEYTQSLIDSMQVGLVVIEEQSRTIIDVNRAAEVLIGARREDIVGKVCHQFICPRQHGQCPIIDEAQVIDKSERVLLDMSGKRIPILKTVVRREKDGVAYLVENFIDISERKATEEELRKARDLSQIIFNAMYDPICLIDASTLLIINANKRFLEHFGDNSIGRKCHEATHNRNRPCDTPTDDCPLHRCKTTGLPASSEHIHHDHHGGRNVLEISAYPIKDESGRVIMIVHVERDITARKDLENELRRARDAAEEASEAKNMFLANMSHEIRTPMNGIIGFADLLLTTPLGEDQRQYLNYIKLSSDRLLKLVSDVLDFSRIEAGRFELEKKRFSLRRIVVETLNCLLIQARDKGLCLKWRVADNVPDSVVGDMGRLCQILINIVANAIKFTPDGEVELTVRLKELGERSLSLLFAVRDTGIGIAEEKMESIFSPFIQADPSHTRRYEGVGLGLSISKQLVTMMGGTIWVKNNTSLPVNEDLEMVDPRGTTFFFTLSLLPATDEDNSDDKDVDNNDGLGDSSLESVRILLVEDEMVNRALMANFIGQQKGWEVTLAGSGREAVTVVEKESFDLIFMDVQMPDMDGLEASARIRVMERQCGVHVPIVAITAHAMKGDRERCLAAGMDDYLAKPVTASALIAAVRRHVGKGR